jgi:hypothetical protein
MPQDGHRRHGKPQSPHGESPFSRCSWRLPGQARAEFLRAFAKTDSKKRKDLKDAFITDPTKPISEIVTHVEKERAQQIVIAFKASPELVDRIDSHRQTMNDATRSDAVKDLVERGLREVGLEVG